VTEDHSHHLQKANHPLRSEQGRREGYGRNIIHICAEKNFKRKKPLQIRVKFSRETDTLLVVDSN